VQLAENLFLNFSAPYPAAGVDRLGATTPRRSKASKVKALDPIMVYSNLGNQVRVFDLPTVGVTVFRIT
jgi:hypothetical protein